jgi:hypothetical protein
MRMCGLAVGLRYIWQYMPMQHKPPYANNPVLQLCTNNAPLAFIHPWSKGCVEANRDAKWLSCQRVTQGDDAAPFGLLQFLQLRGPSNYAWISKLLMQHLDEAVSSPWRAAPGICTHLAVALLALGGQIIAQW